MSTEYELDLDVADKCKIQLAESQTAESAVAEVFERAKLSNLEQVRVSEKISFEERDIYSNPAKIQPPLPPPRPDQALHLNRVVTGDRIQYPSPNEKQDSSSTVVDSNTVVQMDTIPEAVEHFQPQNQPVEKISSLAEPFAALSACSAAHEVPKGGRKSIGKWLLGKTIGEGSSGKVKLALHQDTKETCVVKAVRRPKLADGRTTANVEDLNKLEDKDQVNKIFKRELYMIREACLGIMLNHPNIVKLTSAVLGENHFYCFFEIAEGEDLVDFISKNGPLPEIKARGIFRQVVSAIEYIHRNHVAHRDIKLENIRFNNITGTAKLLDFGFASFYSPRHLLETNCGSPCYACPEIYDNKPYDPQLVDVWSLGVCLFGMVTGSLPFDGNDFKTLAASVRSGKIVYPEKYLTGLLGVMLKTDPRKRITVAGVVKHPWTNLRYFTLPIDYMERRDRNPEPTISLEWVKCLQAADMCQAGCILMNELMGRISYRKPMDDRRTVSSPESTDEESSTKEDGSNFLSNMTIKDKKLSKIWWKRIFNKIVNRMGKSKKQEAPPLPPRPDFNEVGMSALPKIPKSSHRKENAVNKLKAFSSAVLNSLSQQQASNATGRHRRFRWFK